MTQRLTNPVFGPQPFKLGLFTYSHRGGGFFTTVPERWAANWDDIARLARLADQAGLDFMLPLSGWRGWQGEVDHRRWSFETLTLAASLAGFTQNIGLFATVAVPFIHPLFAAKCMSTIDHASHGRAGLNIVCTWGPDESAMFGLELREHDTRYQHGQEWFEIYSRCLAEGQDEFDYHGRFFHGVKLFNQPPSVQQPCPATLSAGFSAAGRDFANRNADFLLTAGLSREKARAEIELFHRRGTELGVPTPKPVLTVTTIVCRPTRQEAQDYNDRYSSEMIDNVAMDEYLAKRRMGAAMPEFPTPALERQFHAGGANVAGSPDEVADYLIGLRDAGYAGTAVQFVNFLDELPYFVEAVLPRLEEAGLRLPAKRVAPEVP